MEVNKKYKPELSWLVRNWRRQLYSKVENLFIYENLPEEINVQAMQLGLMRFGKLVFYKIGDKFVVQKFSYTDKLDWYYIPKFGRVVNPWLPIGHQNFEFEINKEAVLYSCTPNIYSYKEWGVEADLIQKTATQLAENDVSYYCIQRNHRLIAILTAQDDKQRAEANRILQHMYNGDAEIVMKEDLVNRIQVNPISLNATRSPLTELVEFQQYILANFYHSFGINSNYNLKREQLNSSEIDVNREVLKLNIEDMLVCREKGVERINEIYGLNIRVHLNEKVYATLLADAENTEQWNNPEEVQKDEQPGFENSTEKGNTDVGEPSSNGENANGTETVNEQYIRDSGSSHTTSSTNKSEENAQEDAGEAQEDTNEVHQNAQSPEETAGDDSKEVSVTVIVNNGEISNLGIDTTEESEGEDDVEMRDTESVGDRKSDD